MGKTMILIPHRGESDYRQWRDWFHMGLQKPEGTSWLEMRGYSLPEMRNTLADNALKSDAEWTYWLDDDMLGPNDCLLTLLGHNRPIVCGLYMAKKKKEQRGLAAWMKVQYNEAAGPWGLAQRDGYMSISPEQAGRLVQVDVTAMGCALIHRSVFERVPKPWFVWSDNLSEDFYFFEKVSSALAIKPMIDMECKLRHIGTFVMNANGEFTTLEV